jgi:regulator of CtrA degradation
MSALSFTRTYDEAMGLLLEARDYVAQEHRNRPSASSSESTLILCCEMMRLTTRLTHVMAWLLAQRAVQNGELTPLEAAGEAFALGGHEICLSRLAGIEEIADRWLLTLLDRSERLYLRVERLDERARHLAGSEGLPPPLRRRTGLKMVGSEDEPISR